MHTGVHTNLHIKGGGNKTAVAVQQGPVNPLLFVTLPC